MRIYCILFTIFQSKVRPIKCLVGRRTGNRTDLFQKVICQFRCNFIQNIVGLITFDTGPIFRVLASG